MNYSYTSIILNRIEYKILLKQKRRGKSKSKAV